MNYERQATPLYFQKADILRIFDLSASEYNDLTRDRPAPKKTKKVIAVRLSSISPRLLMTVLFLLQQEGSRRGSGYNLILTLPDLMILRILVSFKRNGLDRSLVGTFGSLL